MKSKVIINTNLSVAKSNQLGLFQSIKDFWRRKSEVKQIIENSNNWRLNFHMPDIISCLWKAVKFCYSFFPIKRILFKQTFRLIFTFICTCLTLTFLISIKRISMLSYCLEDIRKQTNDSMSTEDQLFLLHKKLSENQKELNVSKPVSILFGFLPSYIVEKINNFKIFQWKNSNIIFKFKNLLKFLFFNDEQNQSEQIVAENKSLLHKLVYLSNSSFLQSVNLIKQQKGSFLIQFKDPSSEQLHLTLNEENDLILIIQTLFEPKRELQGLTLVDYINGLTTKMLDLEHLSVFCRDLHLYLNQSYPELVKLNEQQLKIFELYLNKDFLENNFKTMQNAQELIPIIRSMLTCKNFEESLLILMRNFELERINSSSLVGETLLTPGESEKKQIKEFYENILDFILCFYRVYLDYTMKIDPMFSHKLKLITNDLCTFDSTNNKWILNSLETDFGEKLFNGCMLFHGEILSSNQEDINTGSYNIYRLLFNDLRSNDNYFDSNKLFPGNTNLDIVYNNQDFDYLSVLGLDKVRRVSPKFKDIEELQKKLNDIIVEQTDKFSIKMKTVISLLKQLKNQVNEFKLTPAEGINDEKADHLIEFINLQLLILNNCEFRTPILPNDMESYIKLDFNVLNFIYKKYKEFFSINNRLLVCITHEIQRYITTDNKLTLSNQKDLSAINEIVHKLFSITSTRPIKSHFDVFFMDYLFIYINDVIDLPCHEDFLRNIQPNPDSNISLSNIMLVSEFMYTKHIINFFEQRIVTVKLDGDILKLLAIKDNLFSLAEANNVNNILEPLLFNCINLNKYTNYLNFLMYIPKNNSKIKIYLFSDNYQATTFFQKSSFFQNVSKIYLDSQMQYVFSNNDEDKNLFIIKDKHFYHTYIYLNNYFINCPQKTIFSNIVQKQLININFMEISKNNLYTKSLYKDYTEKNFLKEKKQFSIPLTQNVELVLPSMKDLFMGTQEFNDDKIGRFSYIHSSTTPYDNTLKQNIFKATDKLALFYRSEFSESIYESQQQLILNTRLSYKHFHAINKLRMAANLNSDINLIGTNIYPNLLGDCQYFTPFVVKHVEPELLYSFLQQDITLSNDTKSKLTEIEDLCYQKYDLIKQLKIFNMYNDSLKLNHISLNLIFNRFLINRSNKILYHQGVFHSQLNSRTLGSFIEKTVNFSFLQRENIKLAMQMFISIANDPIYNLKSVYKDIDNNSVFNNSIATQNLMNEIINTFFNYCNLQQDSSSCKPIYEFLIETPAIYKIDPKIETIRVILNKSIISFFENRTPIDGMSKMKLDLNNFDVEQLTNSLIDLVQARIRYLISDSNCLFVSNKINSRDIFFYNKLLEDRDILRKIIKATLLYLKNNIDITMVKSNYSCGTLEQQIFTVLPDLPLTNNLQYSADNIIDHDFLHSSPYVDSFSTIPSVPMVVSETDTSTPTERPRTVYKNVICLLLSHKDKDKQNVLKDEWNARIKDLFLDVKKKVNSNNIDYNELLLNRFSQTEIIFLNSIRNFTKLNGIDNHLSLFNFGFSLFFILKHILAFIVTFLIINIITENLLELFGVNVIFNVNQPSLNQTYFDLITAALNTNSDKKLLKEKNPLIFGLRILLDQPNLVGIIYNGFKTLFINFWFPILFSIICFYNNILGFTGILAGFILGLIYLLFNIISFLNELINITTDDLIELNHSSVSRYVEELYINQKRGLVNYFLFDNIISKSLIYLMLLESIIVGIFFKGTKLELRICELLYTMSNFITDKASLKQVLFLSNILLVDDLSKITYQEKFSASITESMMLPKNGFLQSYLIPCGYFPNKWSLSSFDLIINYIVNLFNIFKIPEIQTKILNQFDQYVIEDLKKNDNITATGSYSSLSDNQKNDFIRLFYFYNFLPLYVKTYNNIFVRIFYDNILLSILPLFIHGINNIILGLVGLFSYYSGFTRTYSLMINKLPLSFIRFNFLFIFSILISRFIMKMYKIRYGFKSKSLQTEGLNISKKHNKKLNILEKTSIFGYRPILLNINSFNNFLSYFVSDISSWLPTLMNTLTGVKGKGPSLNIFKVFFPILQIAYVFAMLIQPNYTINLLSNINIRFTDICWVLISEFLTLFGYNFIKIFLLNKFIMIDHQNFQNKIYYLGMNYIIYNLNDTRLIYKHI